MEIAMAKYISKIWKGKGLPDEWKRSVVKPIYKKGDKERVETYKGIIIIDSGYKIYAEWLRRKLTKEREEKKVLDRTQFGFKKGKGTMEDIYVLTEIIEENIRKERGKMFVCFANLKGTVDKLIRKIIWKKLKTDM